MNSVNDEKPRIILEEYKTSRNLPSEPTVLNEPFSIKNFKKKFRIVIVRKENDELEFDLIGLHPYLANTFRRIMLSEVPSMAIEKVFIHNNTSIIQDEVLAHRLGLIPLKADPRLFEYKDASSTNTENDSLEFELKIKCSYNKESNKKESSRVEDMYKNNNVYSKHIKWIPIGEQQKERFKEIDVGPIDSDILIAKMRPGHELDIKMVAVKGTGKDHAKFSPVATAFYRMMPDIKLIKEVTGESAYKLQNCFSPGVITVKEEENGRKIAVINNPRYDIGSRNVYRYDDLKDAVIMTKIQNHFIFTIESVGALKPEDIFKEAVNSLRSKCASLLEELNL
ncbi:DNA-directed RNA polymerases I and III subunit RPAC1 [Diorhabda carinulata]|uniref:DNA-directed RNA polymerases I and III subunit RPAC1 n=1 Tax=Diorhabda carinulata TaxID=1163345 RepID=UPI0025A0C19E|nr:DNA-directed RNA polymerases I and III subunit RPAC1 [Diorhabda carinulata]